MFVLGQEKIMIVTHYYCNSEGLNFNIGLSQSLDTPKIFEDMTSIQK